MNDELYWEAVKQNDSRFDGVFFTCVASTKIFCKPSCKARLPKRENVNFADSILEAEEKGFRACLRCKPKESIAVDEQVLKVVKACKLIEAEESISLVSLGEQVGLSAAHLQRTFKKIIGVSPKKYAEAKRIENFKSGIQEGSEVTEAMYDAGYGSSSRLYEDASGKLGMTPAAYKKGGEGMTIEYTVTDCELGRLLVARTEKGICGVKFGDHDVQLLEDLAAEYSNAVISKGNRNLKEFVDAILEHLAGKRPRLDLPVDVHATAFQMRVWEELRKIPYGETLSYKDVAEKIGNEKAVRAVASACAKNRVALVIPCHRVIGSNGKMSGYRWGIERK
ncbi:MAG: bifunctional DNA-binding transcriptional regulator/O6-methylguanine-DNA methyltransferase Ada, partial [Acidobacteria bacterium]|nr:bifunctional DNA-binding transcriptional regulator/O6-methylguanine-DNA methyltransferase Ada [Acidobacteriota bacterium]